MGVDLLAAAEALLPARPDLAAAVATQALDAAAAADDRNGWFAAAGVILGARGRSGDGRRTAVDLLAAARRWDSGMLTAPAARRLRVELALLAAGAGAAETVRALVAPVLAAGTGGSDRALRPAARIALARSATDPVESTAALRAAREDCTDDRAGRTARVEVVLVGAAIARHDGAARTAVEFAEEGLRLLDGDPAVDDRDLRLSLVAESIAALLDVGDTAQARERAETGIALLRSTPGPRRQRALLQLTVVSAFAGVRDMAETVAALAAAAQEAADSDAPELEAICRSALGAIHEKAGRLDAALAEFQAGVNAQHRDRDREQRFVTAVDAHVALEAPAAPSPAASAPSTPSTPRLPVAEPSVAEAPAAAPQADGISWLAGSAWGVEAESRDGDGTDTADPSVDNPWSGGAWSNGGHRVAAGTGPTDGAGGRAARREARSSAHGTNGHDHSGARPARHAKPDPSQLRARDARTVQEQPAPETDPLAPGWTGEQVSAPGADDRVVDSDEVQSWMQTALEELDRVWGPLPTQDAPGRASSNGRGDATGTDPVPARPAAGRGSSTAEPADPAPRQPDAGPPDGEGDNDRPDVDAGALWPPFGRRSDADRSAVSPARKAAGGRSGAHRSPDAEEDERNRRSAVRADATAREAVESPLDEEWPLGLSVRQDGGGRRSRRAPEGAGSRARKEDPPADSDASAGGTRVPADAAADEWPLGRTARGVIGGSGSDSPAGGEQARSKSASQRALDGAIRAEWPPFGVAPRGGSRAARNESNDVPAGDERAPSGRAARRAAAEQPDAAVQVSPGSTGENRGARTSTEHASGGSRASDAFVAGGARSLLDGASGDEVAEWPSANGNGSRHVPDGSAAGDQLLGRAGQQSAGSLLDGPSRVSPEGLPAADLQSPWGADEGWPPAAELPGRRERAERELGVSAESDALFALLRAQKTPVSKDALADLARRLTVAPQRLSITSDAPDDRPSDERNGAAAASSDGARAESGAVGCTVVVDLARDGRRFAGIRAATVIREVAELVAEHVPAGSRVRFDEPDVLALVLPGWEGPDATRWMYRTLPGLLAGFVASEEIRGVQLRATVHDVDGPVGAQLLHRIDGGRGGAASRLGNAPEEPAARRADPAPEPPRAAPRTAERPPPRPVERAAHRAADRPARDEAATTTQERVKPDTPAPTPTQTPFTPAEADGLGLADLLAGALAAYRSI